MKLGEVPSDKPFSRPGSERLPLARWGEGAALTAVGRVSSAARDAAKPQRGGPGFSFVCLLSVLLCMRSVGLSSVHKRLFFGSTVFARAGRGEFGAATPLRKRPLSPGR